MGVCSTSDVVGFTPKAPLECLFTAVKLGAILDGLSSNLLLVFFGVFIIERLIISSAQFI